MLKQAFKYNHVKGMHSKSMAKYTMARRAYEMTSYLSKIRVLALVLTSAIPPYSFVPVLIQGQDNSTHHTQTQPYHQKRKNNILTLT